MGAGGLGIARGGRPQAWDGVEACREIMDGTPDIRVVMLTASSE